MGFNSYVWQAREQHSRTYHYITTYVGNYVIIEDNRDCCKLVILMLLYVKLFWLASQ